MQGILMPFPENFPQIANLSIALGACYITIFLIAVSVSIRGPNVDFSYFRQAFGLFSAVGVCTIYSHLCAYLNPNY